MYSGNTKNTKVSTLRTFQYALGMHSETNSENARGAFSLFVGSNFS